MKAVFLDAGTFTVATDAPTSVAEFVCYAATAQDDALIVERCREAAIVIVNKVVITKAVIDALPKLRLIQVAATGINNVDVSAAHARAVKVMNVAGYAGASVPEHTLMLMLSTMRAGRYYHECVSDGTWQADGRFCLMDVPIFDLAGRTLGIIGAGMIGRRVGALAQAFGMRVLYAERPQRAPRSAEYTEFNRVLAQAEVISLHCALNEHTHHLVNDAFIDKLGKCPLLVNVARGAVVDGAAIVRGLEQGKILGYASDVFVAEPPAPEDPLLAIRHHPRVVFTPHNAWASSTAQARLWQILCQQVNEFVVADDRL